MSQYYYNPGHQSGSNVHSSPFSTHQNHHHHGPRPRRGRNFYSQNSNRSSKNNTRAPRENLQLAQTIAFRKDFEAARSFELDDDEIFCPVHLLTEDDLQSIHSSSSDRSSLSSGSPESSPLQNQLQPTPTFTLSGAANAHVPMSTFQQGNASQLKLHQPLAQRTRNAIPIVDPNSRNASPPNSISPGRQVQKSYMNSRRWQ